MKPYGKNDKEKNYSYGYAICGCYYCVPVRKSTKKSERQKAKVEIKKIIPNRKKNASRQDV